MTAVSVDLTHPTEPHRRGSSRHHRDPIRILCAARQVTNLRELGRYLHAHRNTVHRALHATGRAEEVYAMWSERRAEAARAHLLDALRRVAARIGRTPGVKDPADHCACGEARPVVLRGRRGPGMGRDLPLHRPVLGPRAGQRRCTAMGLTAVDEVAIKALSETSVSRVEYRARGSQFLAVEDLDTIAGLCAFWREHHEGFASLEDAEELRCDYGRLENEVEDARDEFFGVRRDVAEALEEIERTIEALRKDAALPVIVNGDTVPPAVIAHDTE